jgi:PHD/YefM family antitoxin component YafN of YafNO toxin-antitoxin module
MTTQIAVDAEISVTEMRSEETLDQRLQSHSALRLRRRNELLGVIVTPERWKSIEQTINQLLAVVARLEEAADLDLIQQRANAKFVPATDSVWDDVENRFQELTRGTETVRLG